MIALGNKTGFKLGNCAVGVSFNTINLSANHGCNRVRCDMVDKLRVVIIWVRLLGRRRTETVDRGGAREVAVVDGG